MDREDIITMNRFYAFVSIAGVAAVLITFLLARFFRNKTLVKYIPSIIAALGGICFYIKSVYFSTGFEDLAYIVLTLAACVVFFLSFITAFILGMIQRNNKT